MSVATRTAAVAFPVVIVGAAATLVAAAAGVGIGVPWMILAGLALAAGAVAGAGLATVAFARREAWWGVALVLAWPVAVPIYVGTLRRRRRSPDPEV